jgi:hypothetical protein
MLEPDAELVSLKVKLAVKLVASSKESVKLAVRLVASSSKELVKLAVKLKHLPPRGRARHRFKVSSKTSITSTKVKILRVISGGCTLLRGRMLELYY